MLLMTHAFPLLEFPVKVFHTCMYARSGANNYPLKGGKGTSWQGGIRGTAFVTGGFLPTEMQGKISNG